MEEKPYTRAMTDHTGLVAVCIVGKSDAGKTTLVERLVPKLADGGRVGTIKSIHHDIEVDRPGTDTDRHRQAGAEAVVGITPGATFTIENAGKRQPPADPDEGWLFEGDASDELRALEAALAGFRRRNYAFVVIEGYHDAPLPTIVVGERKPGLEGEVVGRDSDGLETLVETIRGLEPVG